MTTDDIDRKELKLLVDAARVCKLSSLDTELERASNIADQVTVAFCRLDDSNWVSAISSPHLEDTLLTWNSGWRCSPMNEARYQPAALIHVINKATTAQEQDQPRFILIPISSKLRGLITWDEVGVWKGQSETTKATALAKVIAAEILNNNRIEAGPIMSMLHTKVPNTPAIFDPFEL